MKIRLTTEVKQDYLKVKDGFNADLFKALNPPFPPVKLLRFDGSSRGDLVSLELNFILFKQVWTSEITADHLDEKEFYFIDEGIKLPFFLKKWRHKHLLISCGKDKTLIVDEINYSGPNLLLSLLIYPVLYLQFSLRNPVYKKVFSAQ
jgi:ligand-binding SRPBCC domain-containing protein